MSRFTPFQWFDGKAEEAAGFYVSVFENSRILKVVRHGEEGPGPKGTVMTVAFELDGQPFVALNGGPQFKFTPAISFVVNCRTQQEIDTVWDHLSAGGSTQGCGWVTDKYGVSWQVVPASLGAMLGDADAEKSRRVMKAMLQMNKMDLGVLAAASSSSKEVICIGCRSCSPGRSPSRLWQWRRPPMRRRRSCGRRSTGSGAGMAKAKSTGTSRATATCSSGADSMVRGGASAWVGDRIGAAAMTDPDTSTTTATPDRRSA